MAYPITKKLFLFFPLEYTGKTPQFVTLKRTDTMADVTPVPTIVEVGNGIYYYSWTFEGDDDPEILFLINSEGTIGNPSLNMDDSTVKSGTFSPAGQTSIGVMSGMLQRALGLLHENSVLDQTVYNSENKMTSARIRLYDTAANAEAAGSTGLIATYSIVATYLGANLLTYTMTLSS